MGPSTRFPSQEAGQKQRLRQRVGIRTFVVASLVVPIVTAVGLTGWLSLRNNQRAVDSLVNRLSEEATAKVNARIQTFADTPYQYLQINQAAVRSGNLRLDELENLGKFFWYQTQINPAVPYVYYGSTSGDFVGVWRQSEALTTLRFRDQTTAPNRTIHELDETGNRGELVRVQEYDPRTRPWYKAAAEQGGPTWSDIYVFADPPSLGITHSVPFFAEGESLLGVMSVDLTLEDISAFLEGVELSTSGEVFILERSGEMIASSVDEAPFIQQGEDQQRLMATDSENPLIQAAAQTVLDRFGSFNGIQTGQNLTFNLNGRPHYLRVTPVQDGRGLDWLVAVVIPAADFMGQINANTRNTIGLSLLALGVAIAIGVLTSRQITGPIVRLSQASQAIASGDLDQTVDLVGVGEVYVLAESFNQMAGQLKQSFVALEAANQELEQRVAERTAALNDQTEALQQEVEGLLSIVSAVENGDLTVVAEVSPSVTGLVADTFNRLIERFGQIMATVSGAAEQVNQGAEQVESLATAMADNAHRQADAVVQVGSLMENINDLSQGNVQRVTDADTALVETQQAITQGQQEIAIVTDDIDVLQQETQQIMGRAQTLTSYAGLAAQFVKDQKRIASLTRVLAMNASMLSTRASQQQDPAQFTAITREFETIAAQVNDLANQTNESLVVLQQRTEQIQTVVSGLNHDVDSISQRAESLTSGIQQSNQAFDQIKAATHQVALLSQQVTQSSQAIAAATQTTLQSIQAISTIAIETSDRANQTKDQSQTMERLARTLRQNVAFFQLPTPFYTAQVNPSPPSISAPDPETEPIPTPSPHN
jgi:methyl-accepting chemotaxis protein